MARLIDERRLSPSCLAYASSCLAKLDVLHQGLLLPASAEQHMHGFLQEIARLGGETSFLRRGEARLKSNLGFAEDRCSELQREVTILRQQVASFEAIEHEAQVMDEVQRSVAGDSSCAGSIAAKMGGDLCFHDMSGLTAIAVVCAWLYVMEEQQPSAVWQTFG